MSLALLGSFLYYSFVAGITPGPANLISFSTAIRLGRRSALRQWIGLFCGFFLIAVCSAFMIYFAGMKFAGHLRWFSFVGAAYILWLAAKIFRDTGRAGERRGNSAGPEEGTFLFGLCLQFTNVKIIIFCLTALAGFVLPHDSTLKGLLLWSFFLPFTGPLCNLVWLFAGVRLKGLYDGHRRTINVLMAFSLAFCAVSMVTSAF